MTQHTSQVPPGAAGPTTADLVDRLSRFDGPPELFLVNLLAVQCHLASARGGAILRAGGPDGRPDVLAIYPPLAEGAAAPSWLAQAAEAAPEVLAGTNTHTKAVHEQEDLYGQKAGRHLVLVPLRGGQGVRGLMAFVVETRNSAVLEACRDRLEITASLLSLYEMRLTVQRRQMDLQRLRVAMECLSAVNEAGRFTGAAMAMCNEVNSRWQAERVSLGFLKGRYVQVKAMSHTEKISRKMKLVQDIESAMEECLDQDVEILHPAGPEVTYANRAAGDLSRQHGPCAVVSVPIRRAGEVRAVLTVERAPDHPFDLEEAESLRLAAELCAARLVGLSETDRWFGARLAGAARKGLATLVGPKHTWVKVAAILIFAAAVFLIFAKGEYRAEASFVLQAVEPEIVAAPFPGRIDEVYVEPGDEVKKGDLLAKLDTTDLGLELEAATAELSNILSQMDEAKYNREEDKAKQFGEQAKKIKARIALVELQLSQATLKAPRDGYVFTGDWKQRSGSPLQLGEAIFEIGPKRSLWVELAVPEDQVGDVIAVMERTGSAGGELATASYPGKRLDFVVMWIRPVAEAVEKDNVFKIRAEFKDVDLEGEYSWMRPGMEGVAKISIDRRRYAWIWTRKLVNWVRMKLWL